MVQASATAHGAAAVVDGRQQVGNHYGGLKQRLAVHGHQHCLIAEMVTAGGHQPQFAHPEIGAEPGHASDVQGAGRLHQHDDGIQGSGSAEGVQVGQQVGHRLRFHLKARHGGSLATDDLLHQNGVFELVADALKLRAHQPLAGKAVAAGAIDPEQLAAVVHGPLQLKAGLDVGVLLGAPQHPEHQHHASRGSRHHQRAD